GIGGAAATKSVETAESEGKPVGMSKRGAGGKRKKSPTAKRLTPDAVVRRLKMGQAGISCCLDHFGEAGPAAFARGPESLHQPRPSSLQEGVQEGGRSHHAHRALIDSGDLVDERPTQSAPGLRAPIESC